RRTGCDALSHRFGYECSIVHIPGPPSVISVPIPQIDSLERRSDGHRLAIDTGGSIRTRLHNHCAVRRNVKRPEVKTLERLVKGSEFQRAVIIHVDESPIVEGIEGRHHDAIQIAQVVALTDLVLPLSVIRREHRDGFCAGRAVTTKSDFTAD